MLANQDHSLYFWVIKIPASPEMPPMQLPVRTSNGKCAPKPTRVNTKSNPIVIIKTVHAILEYIFLGIKANNNTVSTVKKVMACPEGKLLCPVNVGPMMVKVVLFNDAAGLGTENRVFNEFENTADTNEAEIKASHNLGVCSSRMDNKDKKINASPI